MKKISKIIGICITIIIMSLIFTSCGKSALIGEWEYYKGDWNDLGPLEFFEDGTFISGEGDGEYSISGNDRLKLRFYYDDDLIILDYEISAGRLYLTDTHDDYKTIFKRAEGSDTFTVMGVTFNSIWHFLGFLLAALFCVLFLAFLYFGLRLGDRLSSFISGFLNPSSGSAEYIAYEKQRKHDDAVLSEGGWVCQRCNKVNPSYTGTCSCGNTKYHNISTHR